MCLFNATHRHTSVSFRLSLRRRHVCLLPEYSHAVLLQCRSLRMFAKVSTGIDFLFSCRQVKEKGIYPFATLAPPLRKKWSSCRSYSIQTKRALQDHRNRIIFFHGGWQVLSQPVLVPSFALCLSGAKARDVRKMGHTAQCASLSLLLGRHPNKQTQWVNDGRLSLS